MYMTTDETASFKLQARGQVNEDVGVRALEKCIADIRSWVINDRLLLDDETEVLLIGTRYH